MKAKLLGILVCCYALFLTGCATNCQGCYAGYNYTGTCCMIPNSNGASECDFTDIAAMQPSNGCSYWNYNGCGASVGCRSSGCVVNAAYDTGRCSACNW